MNRIIPPPSSKQRAPATAITVPNMPAICRFLYRPFAVDSGLQHLRLAKG
ncbi:MAG: hypothetical protein ACLQUY_17940 [Ktedonobacterales bacterium]